MIVLGWMRAAEHREPVAAVAMPQSGFGGQSVKLKSKDYSNMIIVICSPAQP